MESKYPHNPSNDKHNKDTKKERVNQEDDSQLNPTFENLHVPETIKNHVDGITNRNKLIPHKEVLNKLIEQIQPIDFKSLAYKKAKSITQQIEQSEDAQEKEALNLQLSKMKVKNNHYQVLTIEHIIKVAKIHSWKLCINCDSIYIYNNAFWGIVSKEQFQRFLGKAAEKMGVPKFTARHYQFREHLFKQFIGTEYFEPYNKDLQKVLINLLNGTFEFSETDIKLREFRSEDFLTYQLGFDYNEEAESPQFKEFLDQVLPDIECQKVLAEFLGYVFIKNGKLKIEKALILFGSGANGKSVINAIVKALLGKDNVTNYSLQSLTERNGYHRSQLANKLLNYGTEISGKLESSTFKILASGEPIEARLPYGKPFIMDNYAKLIFNSNQLFKDVEHTHAYFRRFIILPFNVTIPEKEQDKDLANKIIESELSGIFNWVLKGLHRLLKRRNFTHCQASVDIIESFKTESNTVKLFIQEENLQKTSLIEEAVTLKELYIWYRDFCKADCYHPVNKKTFKKQLLDDGISIERRAEGNKVFLTIPSPLK